MVELFTCVYRQGTSTDELRKARDQPVKQQQTIAEQVADAQAKYGKGKKITHDEMKKKNSYTCSIYFTSQWYMYAY